MNLPRASSPIQKQIGRMKIQAPKTIVSILQSVRTGFPARAKVCTIPRTLQQTLTLDQAGRPLRKKLLALRSDLLPSRRRASARRVLETRMLQQLRAVKVREKHVVGDNSVSLSCKRSQGPKGILVAFAGYLQTCICYLDHMSNAYSLRVECSK